MIGIYHNKDLDGFTSGAIMKLKYPDIKLIGYDYSEKFPWDDIPSGVPVIMADVSLPMEDMACLSHRSVHQFTWIDHHASAIKDFNSCKESNRDLQAITAVLEDGVAACEGAWKFFFPHQEIPSSVLLLGEYDTWRKGNLDKWQKEILPFQFGMRVYCTSPETFPEHFFNNTKLTENAIVTVISVGRNILAYEAQVNAFQCKRASFEFEFQGKKAICLNGGGFNSDVFKSVYDPEKHDIMMPFQFNGKGWSFSMYTTKPDVDCSVLAKNMGGGGHKQAAGFFVKDITTVFPFMSEFEKEDGVKQRALLSTFIKAVKEEFKEQNWDYLDFIADRITGVETQA